MKRHLVSTVQSDREECQIASTLFDFIDKKPDSVNILQDMIYLAETKFFIFVKTAEGTFVPRTVTGDAQQQAVRLARRSDRTKFKALVSVFFFHFLLFKVTKTQTLEANGSFSLQI